MMPELSYRVFLDIPGSFWSDTDPIECRYETPVPARLDKIALKVNGASVFIWTRRDFRDLLADDAEPSGRGRRRRGRGIRASALNADIMADLPANAIAFYSVRGRRGQDGKFRGLRTRTPPRLDIYEIGYLDNACHRHWQIANPVRDSYDDLDRDPTPRRALKQELIVYTFDPTDLTEILDEDVKRVGKRPVPRSAQ